MANHVLSLEAPDTLNSCLIRVIDTSVYAAMPITCPTLQITPPGFTSPVNFVQPEIESGFNKSYTACDLGMQIANCGTSFSNIPDGIYILRYSVSPNDIVYVEYNHLRITCALNLYQSILCELDLAACDPPAETKAKLERLRIARIYLDAAKALVEYCHQPQKGMELYKYAVKLLGKFSCSSCKSC